MSQDFKSSPVLEKKKLLGLAIAEVECCYRSNPLGGDRGMILTVGVRELQLKM